VVNNRFMIRVMSAMHRFWYRLTGGRIGGKVMGAPVLLLTTTGRKTGKQRTTPLLYLTDGDDLVVVASNAGDAKHPAWWTNLKALPKGLAQVKREKRPIVAVEAAPDDKKRLWPKLVEMYPTYDSYQKKTDREIPVVILKRDKQGGP
jgi:deazaflavin-dependent oxidoreductase (nitroreductase family)